MLTRTQKDEIWDIIPTSFDIAGKLVTDDSDVLVTFHTDGVDEDVDGNKDVQVLESFAVQVVRYPTIQIQYANADTRANFQFFKLGDVQDHATYDTSVAIDSWQNVKSSPLTFDITKDSVDATSKIEIHMRMPTDTVTSWFKLELFEKKLGGFFKVYERMHYPASVGQAGKLIAIPLLYPYLNKDVTHRVTISNVSIGEDDTGMEVALDSGGDPIHRYYKPSYFETHGNIENIVASIRVSSDAKIPGQTPAVGSFVNPQDIVDTLVKDIQLAFFRDFDLMITDAQLITASQIIDITPLLSDGQQEQVVGKQIDFLIANVNELRTEYTTPVTADITIIQE